MTRAERLARKRKSRLGDEGRMASHCPDRPCRGRTVAGAGQCPLERFRAQPGGRDRRDFLACAGPAHAGIVFKPQYLAGGAVLASWGVDGAQDDIATLRLRDSTTCALRQTPKPECPLQRWAFSADTTKRLHPDLALDFEIDAQNGRLLTGGLDGADRLWNPAPEKRSSTDRHQAGLRLPVAARWAPIETLAQRRKRGLHRALITS